ncbi:MAG: hypothetical protein ACRELD_08750, partial [Longimicrobiales bacterium]
MRSRYVLLALLFIAVAVGPALLRHERGPAAAATPQHAEVPPEALEAMQQGRYWRASRILRQYLAVVPDTAPETLLLAAQAEAGWHAWPHVERLLGGESWLDRVAGGEGWSLLGRSRFEQGQWAASDEAYRRFLAVAVDAGERERGMAELRRAITLGKQGKTAEALDTFDAASRLLPQLGDWIAVYAAEAAASAGDTAEVTRRLQTAGATLTRERGWQLRVAALRSVRAHAAAQAVAENAANTLDRAA